MRVKVLSYAGFRQILGRERYLDLEEGSTIGDLLRRLCDAHADLKIRLFEGKGLRPDVFIMLNGRSIGLSLIHI
ncbi:MAG: MoaD/ThiS family protein [Methanothrix sp.]|nr:MoaD/ThiS family protein [Methanothrix sp.]